MGYTSLIDGYVDEPNHPHILDSGTRRQFESGAVRDIQEGKGRCDLLPLDVVATYLEGDNESVDWVLMQIVYFQQHGQEHYLYSSLLSFERKCEWDMHTMFLEVSKHFEEGAKKYGEFNWQKGMPVHCFIDSAVRHYLKWLRGDQDEPHDRAFVWNILCCIWTCKHKPELNDYAKPPELRYEHTCEPIAKVDVKVTHEPTVVHITGKNDWESAKLRDAVEKAREQS